MILQGPNAENQAAILEAGLAKRMQDWIAVCASLNQEIVRQIEPHLTSLDYLRGNLYSRLLAANINYAARLASNVNWQLYEMLKELEISALILLSSALEENVDAISPVVSSLDPRLFVMQFKLYWAAVTFDKDEHVKHYVRDDEEKQRQEAKMDGYTAYVRRLLKTVSDEVGKSFRIESLGLTDEDNEMYVRLWASQDSSQHEGNINLAFEYYRILEVVTNYFQNDDFVSNLPSDIRQRLQRFTDVWVSRDATTGALISRDESLAFSRFFVRIEVLYGKSNSLQRIYFPIPPDARAQLDNPLVKSEMVAVMENVKRGNPEEKLDDFLDRFDGDMCRLK